MFILLGIAFWYICNRTADFGLNYITWWQALIVGAILCLTPVCNKIITYGSLYIMIAFIVLYSLGILPIS